jgi:hypothetical protein
MPASAAVSFVEEATCDGLSEGEMMVLSKLEHVAHCFLSSRLAGCSWRCPNGSFLSERKEVRFQRHTAGMSARKEACFNLRPQVKGDSHGVLSSKFTPAQPCSKVDRLSKLNRKRKPPSERLPTPGEIGSPNHARRVALPGVILIQISRLEYLFPMKTF